MHRAHVLDRYERLISSFDEIARRRSSWLGRSAASPHSSIPRARSLPMPLKVDALRAREIGMSKRELEVLKLVAAGSHNKEIAAQLEVSVDTVKSHVRRLLAKLEAATRAEAVAIAFCRKVLLPG